MSFQQKVNEMRTKILELISTKSITFLKDLDRRIKIIKSGKYYYYKFSGIYHMKISWFLNQLEDDNVYVIIPIISANDKPDEPFIVLSQQILVTNKSSSLLLCNYLNDKIADTLELYKSNEVNGILILKYKKVRIHFNEQNSF